MVKVTVSYGSDSQEHYTVGTVVATTETGRRFLYSYPDGKMYNHSYVRYLTEGQYEILANGVQAQGGRIDETKLCWQETDPVYGSLAYELSGIEQQWAERERVEAAWM
jgi:hypothetical protein